MAGSDTGPMEKWNSDALVSLNATLKLKVTISTGLLDILPKAADGFMSPAEAQAVASKPSSAEQMGELIRILLGKRNADFKIFCAMLRKSSNDVWADELERKAKELGGPDEPQGPSRGGEPAGEPDVMARRVHTSPLSISQFLKTYEDEFIAVVNAKQSLLKLKHKGVISPDVRTAIEDANDEDAKFILFEHLENNASVVTLRIYCDVAIQAAGYPRMQALGKEMMKALEETEQAGRMS